MVCKLIQAELVSYELDTIDDAGRDEVEAHLVGCKSCLQTYLRLKRHMARAAESTDRPSAAVRNRIRSEIAEAFQPSLARRLQRWLTRPIPLYQGVATAAFAAVVVMVAPAARDHLESALHSALHAAQWRVDTSRNQPENLTIY